jgi:hypothetical protein
MASSLHDSSGAEQAVARRRSASLVQAGRRARRHLVVEAPNIDDQPILHRQDLPSVGLATLLNGNLQPSHLEADQQPAIRLPRSR